MRLPVFFRRVSSSATGTNRPGQCAKAVGNNVSKRACSFHSLRACRRYSALQSCWSKPKPARMRVSVAVPTTVKEPKAWRKARRKLRSCRNTGRQSETKARKRVSNTAGWSWFYFYQGSIPLHQSPIENVQTPASWLYQEKNSWQKRRASSSEPKRSGKSGRYFSVLKWDSE